MRYIISTLFVFSSLPSLALAQGPTIQSWIKGFITFASDILVPFLLGIAFLIFMINAIRFFVLQSSEEDGRENAKNLALYSVLAFVLIIIFFGIVNVLASSIGLERQAPVVSDYIDGGASTKGQGSRPTGSNSSSEPAPAAPTNDPSEEGAPIPPPLDPELEGLPCEFRVEGC